MSMPNPVARVAGTPPAPQTAATSSPSQPSAGGLAGLSRNQLYIGAAVLVAGFAALSAWRGKAGGDDATVTYEMDTTLSDIQGNFDQLNDRLDQFEDVPRPPVVTPPTVKPPTPVKPAPKPAPPRTSVRYIVKTGDTITKIATLYRVSAANIYGLNKGTIDANAAQRNKRTHGTKTTIYPGMVLTVPWGQPGQRG